MALRFLLDENLRGALWQAILKHNQKSEYALDVVRVGDASAPPLSTDDATILSWAEANSRILISNDRATLASFLKRHLDTGHSSPGIFLIKRGKSREHLVEYLAIVAHTSEPSEWADRIEYLG